MSADRDRAREDECDHEIDDDQTERLSAEHVVALPLEHERCTEDSEMLLTLQRSPRPERR